MTTNLELANSIVALLDLKGRKVRIELTGGGQMSGVLTDIVTREFTIDNGRENFGEWPQSIRLDHEDAYTFEIGRIKKIAIA